MEGNTSVLPAHPGHTPSLHGRHGPKPTPAHARGPHEPVSLEPAELGTGSWLGGWAQPPPRVGRASASHVVQAGLHPLPAARGEVAQRGCLAFSRSVTPAANTALQGIRGPPGCRSRPRSGEPEGQRVCSLSHFSLGPEL